MRAFNRSVFINCPFDSDYRGLFLATIFTIQYLGLIARTSYEQNNGGETRIAKLLRIIRGSKFGIHDLCRCEAAEAGELARMNMPLELGFDYASRQFGGGRLRQKSLLIMDTKPYRVHRIASDLAGSDAGAHGYKQREIVRVVSEWLVHVARAESRSTREINTRLDDFWGAYTAEQFGQGHTAKDLQKQSPEIIRRRMAIWIRDNKPDRPMRF